MARWKSHLTMARNGSNKYIHNALRAYGEGSFAVELLEDVPEDALNTREQYYIDLYKSNDKLHGYNLTAGGNQWKKTPEQCAAISARMKGNKHSVGCVRTEEHKRRIAEATKARVPAMLGRKFSEEHREHMSESAKKRYRQNPKYAETLRLMGTANKGKKRTPEQRERIGNARRGLKQSEETKSKMSEARRLWWERKKLTETQ